MFEVEGWGCRFEVQCWVGGSADLGLKAGLLDCSCRLIAGIAYVG